MAALALFVVGGNLTMHDQGETRIETAPAESDAPTPTLAIPRTANELEAKSGSQSPVSADLPRTTNRPRSTNSGKNRDRSISSASFEASNSELRRVRVSNVPDELGPKLSLQIFDASGNSVTQVQVNVDKRSAKIDARLNPGAKYRVIVDYTGKPLKGLDASSLMIAIERQGKAIDVQFAD